MYHVDAVGMSSVWCKGGGAGAGVGVSMLRGRGIPLNGNRKVSKFLGFFISKFQSFEIPKLHISIASKPERFKKSSKVPYHVSERY